jgi:hypothetical protein
LNLLSQMGAHEKPAASGVRHDGTAAKRQMRTDAERYAPRSHFGRLLVARLGDDPCRAAMPQYHHPHAQAGAVERSAARRLRAQANTPDLEVSMRPTTGACDSSTLSEARSLSAAAPSGLSATEEDCRARAPLLLVSLLVRGGRFQRGAGRHKHKVFIPLRACARAVEAVSTGCGALWPAATSTSATR